MTAQVSINIGGQAVRRVTITRLTNIEPRTPERFAEYKDEVNEYEATLLYHNYRVAKGPVTFWHRYGDSETILVAEAARALEGEIPVREAPPVRVLTPFEQLDALHEKWVADIAAISEFDLDRWRSRQLFETLLAELDALDVVGPNHTSPTTDKEPRA